MKKNLKIIIPVAGVGTRLQPHTFTVPKPLISVAGQPILAHIIQPLLELKPEEVIFVIGHLGHKIVDYVRSAYDFKAKFVEQSELLGLGFAVHLALQDLSNGPILVVLGDTIAKTDFKAFINHGDNVIGLQKVEDPRRFGVAVVEDERIIALEEKPQKPRSDLAVIGLYYFQKSDVLKKYLEKVIALGKKTGGEVQLTDAMEFMAKDGHVIKPFLVDDWYDCGKRETLLSTNKRLLNESSEVNNHPGSIIIPPVHIASSAILEDSIIGPFVSIAEDAQIFRSIIRDSVICDKAIVEDSLLESSLIGEGARIKGIYNRLNVGGSSEVG
ncbi:MAG: sugar phosphate nucleotidyltransferase [Candidatus Zixiibacteriota bacterium]